MVLWNADDSNTIDHLVGGLEHILFCHSIGNFIISSDELIFVRGVAKNHQPVAKLAKLVYNSNNYTVIANFS